MHGRSMSLTPSGLKANDSCRNPEHPASWGPISPTKRATKCRVHLLKRRRRGRLLRYGVIVRLFEPDSESDFARTFCAHFYVQPAHGRNSDASTADAQLRFNNRGIKGRLSFVARRYPFCFLPSFQSL